MAQSVKNLPAMKETWVRSLGWEDSPGRGHGNSLQYSCLENPMDRGAWQGAVHRVTKNWTWLSDHVYRKNVCNSNRGSSKISKWRVRDINIKTTKWRDKINCVCVCVCLKIINSEILSECYQTLSFLRADTIPCPFGSP